MNVSYCEFYLLILKVVFEMSSNKHCVMKYTLYISCNCLHAYSMKEAPSCRRQIAIKTNKLSYLNFEY